MVSRVIKVRGDKELLQRYKRMPLLMRTAANEAVRQTVDEGKKTVIRRVREEVPLPRSILAARTVRQHPFGTTLEGRLTFKREGIKLIHYPYTQTSRGIRYQARRNRTVFIRSGFIRKGLIMKRARARPGSLALVPRYPIYLKYGPSMHELVRAVYPSVEGDLRADLQVRLDAQLRKLLA